MPTPKQNSYFRRTAIYGFIAAGVLLGLTAGGTYTPVHAADAGQGISDEQADQVRQNCKQAQSVLQRLQSTDVATRVNRGRIYENLINRLITPFNNRVNVNRYDASSLALATSQINQKFTDFKNDYSVYENSFSSLLSLNCESDPRGFYSLLDTTRTQRTVVADDVTSLNTLISQYTDAFTALRKSIEG